MVLSGLIGVYTFQTSLPLFLRFAPLDTRRDCDGFSTPSTTVPKFLLSKIDDTYFPLYMYFFIIYQYYLRILFCSLNVYVRVYASAPVCRSLYNTP